MAKDKEQTVEQIAHELVQEFLTQLGLDAEITIVVPEPEDEKEVGFKYLNLTLVGENLGEIIGFRGNMLESIQTILSLMLTKTLLRKEMDSNYRILLDINDYKQQREKYLISYAQRASEEVKTSGQPMELSPMKPAERRIIHLALKTENGIETSSVGEGESRRVVISPISK